MSILIIIIYIPLDCTLLSSMSYYSSLENLFNTNVKKAEKKEKGSSQQRSCTFICQDTEDTVFVWQCKDGLYSAIQICIVDI